MILQIYVQYCKCSVVHVPSSAERSSLEEENLPSSHGCSASANFLIFKTSVVDPDPLEPCGFEPPGSRSAKIVRETLITTVL